MGQILSSIGVPHYLQFILFTIFPSLLLITQLYHVCYVVNKQRDDAIHETIRSHQKKYFESLADVYHKLESLDTEKQHLLMNLEDQKRLSEETFKQEMAYVHDAMRQNAYQLRATNAALDNTTFQMNAAYKGFNDSDRKMGNKIRDLEAIDTMLINKVERLELANRGGYVPASFKKAYQSLNITKRYSSQAAIPTRKSSLLQAQVSQSNAHGERLNKTVYGQDPSAAQQAPLPPSVGQRGSSSTSSASGSASTSASVRVNVSSSPSTRSKQFRNSVRRKYDRIMNRNKRESWASLTSTLRINLKPQQHQRSSSDPSNASTSSSSSDQPTTPSTTTSGTTASKSTMESKIESLHLAFNKQLKGIHTKIDRLASKVKKSKQPQATTVEAHRAPEGSSSSTTTEQPTSTAPLDLQVKKLRHQVSDFYREFVDQEKCYSNHVETLFKDIAAVSTKQKELDIDNRSRWAAYETFRERSQGELGELLSRYEATTAFQMKKIGDSEFNIEKLQDVTKRHQESLDSLAQTLGQLDQEVNKPPAKLSAKALGKQRATRTSVVLHEKQRREDQRLKEPSAAKFIHRMEGALKSDQAILDHNSKRLFDLQQKLETSRDVENLNIQRELLDKEFNEALHQIAMIKKKIEPEFEYPPPLQQEAEGSRAFNQRRDQFLRQ